MEIKPTLDARIEVLQVAMGIRSTEKTLNLHMDDDHREEIRDKIRNLIGKYFSHLQGTPEGAYIQGLGQDYGMDAKLIDTYDKSVDELGLSLQRTRNCLQAAGIHFIGELTSHSETEILRIKYMGRRGLTDIKDALQQLNPRLRLGMATDYVRPEDRK